MRALRALTVLAVLATLAWCGYWVIGQQALDRAIRAGLAHVPEVSAGSHSIGGFPNRFDVTFNEPRVAVDGVTWTAPFVQIMALSYQPNRLIAVFAHDQALRVNGTEASLHSEDLRASMAMDATLDLPLDRVTLVGQGLDLLVGAANNRFDSLRLASRRIGPAIHEIAALAETVYPDTAMMDRMDPQGLWPRRFDVLRLDAEVAFDRPLDRHLFDGAEPRLSRLTLTGARVAWDGVDIVAAGRLTPDAEGRLSGDVTLTVTGWRRLLDLARAQGLLTPENQTTLAGMLGAMATGEGGATIAVPLAVVDGDLRMGPVVLGTLPPLR
ncbi:MAG: DUF2125 domain-containing protein [Rhodobacter sp.]|nr:DUF2125 domain-containing protein [Paracoccaceae bacterium]MCC0074714.1 DUF2125 domain-containing protein [Rhodobacter sp.]